MKMGWGGLMIRQLAILALLAAVLALAQQAVAAPAAKVPCSSFQKLPDGKWKVLRAVKIQNGQVSVVLNPGSPISPGARVTGVDIYAALEASCAAAASPSVPGARP
jgi:hypothetical protein